MPVMDSGEDAGKYDPEQSLEERREIQRSIREIERDMHENAEAYMQLGSTKVAEALARLQAIGINIKQTNEAVIDSKALVTLVDLHSRRIQKLTSGNLGNGIDTDEFVSKCITYMRRGAGIAQDDTEELTHTQRNRRASAQRVAIGSDDDASDEEEGGDMMDWAHLGRYACIPNTRRPALSGFLLGPLSVQKKVRKLVTRTAPLRVRDLQEVRPEVLDTEDLAKNENDLAATCNKILKQLKSVRDSAIEELSKMDEDDNIDGEQQERAMEILGITETGNIDLVRFCINPWSFGQTVENMFYVSFLIREGMVEVHYEENGLPSLCPSSAGEKGQASNSVSNHGTMKRQAIMAIDMPTWRDLIEAFKIREPIIEHRQDPQTQGPGARGWYS